MIDLIKELAAANEYEPLQIDWPYREFPVYIGTEFKDIIVIAEYSHNEIMTFFDSDNIKTAQIMTLYERIAGSAHSNSAKDILLAVAYKMDSPISAHSATVATQIMRIEENKFGMRIAVLKYTETGLGQLHNEKEISNAITERKGHTVAKQDAELTYEETMETALGTEPTFTALQMYAKLPFLSLTNVVGELPITSIDEKINTLIGDDRSLIDGILKLDSADYELWPHDRHLSFLSVEDKKE